jgi:hypothetical protein
MSAVENCQPCPTQAQQQGHYHRGRSTQGRKCRLLMKVLFKAAEYKQARGY